MLFSFLFNLQEHEALQRGDSDDEIAELRFQALLTKRENEAEISPTRQQLLPPPHVSINQPLPNFHDQYPSSFEYHYIGRGRGRSSGRGRATSYRPYLQSFSQVS